jgi:GNAT superfamily N-acetyltransferase
VEFQRYSDDWQDALIELHRSAMVGISHGIDQQAEERDLRAIEAEYLSARGEFLIGFQDERLVAMGGFRLTRPGIAELKRLRIAPSLQGSGIGSQLLVALETEALARGIGTLVLETSARREGTLAFWRRRGYLETGRGLYGTEAVVYFEKQLEVKSPLV